jgi:transposase
MCRPSLVHPRPIRQLRDLTRYRRSLIHDRTREMQRVEKLLEDAQIKLSSVATDIFGVSGRAILEALVAGQRDPKVLAQLAKARLRVKLAALEEALRGFFTDHHAAILRMMLDNIDRHTQQIAVLDTKIEQAVAPFARQVAQLDEITGVGVTAAQELIAEVGVDMGRFASAAHLVSWARFCPQVHESAGKTKPKGRGKGNPWLAGTLGNIVATAARTDSFLGARYRRIAKRRGKQKAMVATGNSVLVIVYHLLADPAAHFYDLGSDHYQSRINHERRARNLASQLQAVTGQRIMIRNGKAVIVEPDAA